MPIKKIEAIEEQAIWGLWKIDEDINFLASNTLLSNAETIELGKIHLDKRISEWLGARLVLKQLHDHLKLPYSGTVKDENNKPFLVKSSNHISMAHCYPYAAAMIHFNHSCGIDIETPKPVLIKLAAKFLSDEELKYIPQEPNPLCTAWTAKEVLYKVFGKRNISFKNNLKLNPFTFNSTGQIEGIIHKDNFIRTYLLKYQQLGDHVICLSLK